MAETGENWFLGVLAFVAVLICLAASVYLMVAYLHPNDSPENQGWWPKILMLLALAVTMYTVLLFPLDVMNRDSCATYVPLPDCRLTLPMLSLWRVVYVLIVLLMFTALPFAIVWLNTSPSTNDDNERWRIKFRTAGLSALMLTVGFSVCVALGYVVIGKLNFNTASLQSSMIVWEDAWGNEDYVSIQNCLVGSMELTYDMSKIEVVHLSTASIDMEAPKFYETMTRYDANDEDDFDSEMRGPCDHASRFIQGEFWRFRAGPLIFMIGLFTLVSWIPFTCFAGLGMITFPTSMIASYLGRPRAFYTKEEYRARAADIAVRAAHCRKAASILQERERRTGRNAEWARQSLLVRRHTVALEEDSDKLQSLYPTSIIGRKAQWGVLMLTYWLKGFVGVIATIIAALWLIHIGLYVLPKVPKSAMLNAFFGALESQFTILGVCGFAVFCLYMLIASVRGYLRISQRAARSWLSLFLGFYPVAHKGTVMPACLVNIGLVLLSTSAITNFCAVSFAAYANETAIMDIFLVQVSSLHVIGPLLRNTVFLYILLGLNFITATIVAYRYFIAGSCGQALLQEQETIGKAIGDDLAFAGSIVLTKANLCN